MRRFSRPGSAAEALVRSTGRRRASLLFRAGIAADLFTGVMVIFVTLAFVRLFSEVDRDLARLMVILGSLMVTPIYFLNTLNDVAALTLARGADFLAAFDKPQRDALVALFLRLHHAGVVVNEIFWGLWLFPLGLLLYRSRFFPRVLGGWQIVNGFAYLAVNASGILFPAYEQAVSNVAFPAMLGGLVTMVWLVIVGAKEAANMAPQVAPACSKIQ